MASRTLSVALKATADGYVREVKSAKTTTDDLSAGVKRVGAAWRDAAGDSAQFEGSVRRVGGSLSGLNSRLGRGGADWGRYRGDLDGTADGFNDLEDRAMGVGNVIGGLGDISKGSSQGMATLAMGVSDTAAGIRYALVPSVQDAARSAKGLLEGMRESGGAAGVFRRNLVAIGTAAAGATAAIGLVTMALADQSRRQEESRQRVSDYTAQLRELGGDTEALTARVVLSSDRFEFLRSQLGEAGITADEFAHQVRNGTVDVEAMADQLGLTRGETLALHGMTTELTKEVGRASDALDTNAAAAEGTEEAQRSLAEAIDAARTAVTEYHDAIQAQFDPLFSFMDATRSAQDAIAAEAEAQQALNDAIAEHGPTSAEAAKAQADLDEAHQGVAESALKAWASEEDLRVALQTGAVTTDDMRARLAQLEQQGYGSGAAAAWLRDQINSIESKNATITVYDQATGTIESVRRNLDSLDGREATTFIRTVLSYRVPGYQTFGGGYAGGGVVYADRGWMGGPRGTDTVPAWLTPGEMVLNQPQQANLFRLLQAGRMTAMGAGGFGGFGGGARVSIDLSGADHFFMEWLRKRIRVQHGGNVQAALGFSR